MKSFLLSVLGLILLFRLAAAAPQNFSLHDAPKPIPEVTFVDESGRTSSLSDFAGKVVLLNVWATWCLPCRKEMPTLDRLEQMLAGPDFEVVTLSIDRGGADTVRKFYAEIGVQHLAVRVDSTAKAAGALGAFGLPTTILMDRQGRELGRLVGPAEWDQPDMVAFLKQIIGGSAAPQ
jgi:thiol-disulfide isomerase/thioredoxin